MIAAGGPIVMVIVPMAEVSACSERSVSSLTRRRFDAELPVMLPVMLPGPNVVPGGGVGGVVVVVGVVVVGVVGGPVVGARTGVCRARCRAVGHAEEAGQTSRVDRGIRVDVVVRRRV